MAQALCEESLPAVRPRVVLRQIAIVGCAVESELPAGGRMGGMKPHELFAAAPYTSQSVVTAATDSSRFFAIRVQGQGGMKATLGIGFEDRSEAIDFGIALQEASKLLGFAPTAGIDEQKRRNPSSVAQSAKPDFRLKDGENITINIGGKSKVTKANDQMPELDAATIPFLPPPPSAADVKIQRDAHRGNSPNQFDDDFGDFQ